MAGKVCWGEQSILLHRGERSAVAVVHGNMFYRKLCRYSHGPFLRTTFFRSNHFETYISFFNGRQLIYSMSMHHCEKSHRVYPQQRSGGSFGCYSFSSPLTGGWLVPGDEDRIGKNRTLLTISLRSMT